MQFRDRAGNTANALVYLTPQQFRISATAGEGGDIEPWGDVVVAGRSNQTFTITPDPGHVVGTVLADGREVTLFEDNTWLFPDVEADHTISVTFEQTGTGPDGNGDGNGDGADDGEGDTDGGGGTCFVSVSEGE